MARLPALAWNMRVIGSWNRWPHPAAFGEHRMATVLSFPGKPDEEKTALARMFELALAGEKDTAEFHELEAIALRGLTRWCAREKPALSGTAHFWAG